KRLALLNPDHPGNSVEAPAFVSPYCRDERCRACGGQYGPLYYQIGRATRSLHCGPIFTFPVTAGSETLVWTVLGEQPDAATFTPLRLALDCLRCLECGSALAARDLHAAAFALAPRYPGDRFLLPLCRERDHWWYARPWNV